MVFIGGEVGYVFEEWVVRNWGEVDVVEEEGVESGGWWDIEVLGEWGIEREVEGLVSDGGLVYSGD